MTLKEIHRYIWQYVAERLGTSGEEGSVKTLKMEAARSLYNARRIPRNMYRELSLNDFCVLCMVAESECEYCPLTKAGQCCRREGSWYNALCNTAPAPRAFAEKIRDLALGPEYDCELEIVCHREMKKE